MGVRALLRIPNITQPFTFPLHTQLITNFMTYQSLGGPESISNSDSWLSVRFQCSLPHFIVHLIILSSATTRWPRMEIIIVAEGTCFLIMAYNTHNKLLIQSWNLTDDDMITEENKPEYQQESVYYGWRMTCLCVADIMLIGRINKVDNGETGSEIRKTFAKCFFPSLTL